MDEYNEEMEETNLDLMDELDTLAQRVKRLVASTEGMTVGEILQSVRKSCGCKSCKASKPCSCKPKKEHIDRVRNALLGEEDPFWQQAEGFWRERLQGWRRAKPELTGQNWYLRVDGVVWAGPFQSKEEALAYQLQELRQAKSTQSVANTLRCKQADIEGPGRRVRVNPDPGVRPRGRDEIGKDVIFDPEGRQLNPGSDSRCFTCGTKIDPQSRRCDNCGSVPYVQDEGVWLGPDDDLDQFTKGQYIGEGDERYYQPDIGERVEIEWKREDSPNDLFIIEGEYLGTELEQEFPNWGHRVRDNDDEEMVYRVGGREISPIDENREYDPRHDEHREEKSNRRRCKQCKGSGNCMKCSGEGILKDMKRRGYCKYCDGSGNCKACGGTGETREKPDGTQKAAPSGGFKVGDGVKIINHYPFNGAHGIIQNLSDNMSKYYEVKLDPKISEVYEWPAPYLLVAESEMELVEPKNSWER